MSNPDSTADPQASPSGMDPFVHAKGGKSYFVTSALRQRIDLIWHLIEFGRQIIVLTGPQGAGKSTLLEQACELQGENTQLLTFVAGPTLNRATLLSKIADELGIVKSIDEEDRLDSIRRHVMAATMRGETTMLAIDDAHKLPPDSPACLAELAHCADEAAEIKVILCTDPAQSPLIDQLQNESPQHTLVHVVEIPRFNTDQTEGMLKHRWMAAYGNDEMPLKSAQLTQIHYQSGGIPGKAIVLARQVQILSANSSPSARDPAKRYLIIGSLIIAAVLLFAFFNADISTVSNGTQIELELPDPVVAVELPATVTTSAIDKIVPQPAPPTVETATPTTVTPLANDFSAPAEPVDSQGSEAQKPLLAKPPIEAESKSIEATVVIIEKSSPTQSKPELAAITPVMTQTPVEAAAVKPYSIKWLRQQPDSGYVIQLFGVRDLQAAEQFIRKRTIDGNSDVLVTKFDGASWFVVVYGYYPDRLTAQRAIADLPENLASAKPWARPIASLK